MTEYPDDPHRPADVALSDDPDASVDAYIAERLRLDLHSFWLLAGRNWRRLSARDRHGSALSDETVEWFIAGEPAQVMLGLVSDGAGVHVARPQGQWRHGLSYTPAEPYMNVNDVTVDLPAALRDAAASRRKAFRWCRYCRTSTPPEYRDDADTCMSCSEDVLGTAH